jgi:membrane protease YdiL (CAAX protease family)
MEILVFVPFLLIVVLANVVDWHLSARQRSAELQADRRSVAKFSVYATLALVNLALLGVAALALLNQIALTFMPDLVESQPQALDVNWIALAIACLLTALAAFLPLIPALRRAVSRWLPIDPESMVHMTALAFAIYQIGLSLGQIALIGDLENLVEAGLTLDIWDLLLTGLPLLLFALLGVGFLIRRGLPGTMARLGLRLPTWRHLLLAAGMTVLLLAFDAGVNFAWQAVDPAGYEKLASVNEYLFGGLMTVGGAVALGLSAGISEELLFRGAIQPRLGLILASALFAIGHLQYGLTIATLEILVIGLVLGVIRNRTSTTICILIHAAYNATGVLLGLLQP